MVALAQAETPLSIHALAQTERLPEDYLEKILQNLRKSDIVKAIKGATGGYILNRASRSISVWDVLRELDGPIKTIPTPKGTLPCLRVSHCQTNEVLRTLEQEIEKTLSKITLEQLTHQHK